MEELLKILFQSKCWGKYCINQSLKDLFWKRTRKIFSNHLKTRAMIRIIMKMILNNSNILQNRIFPRRRCILYLKIVKQIIKIILILKIQWTLNLILITLKRANSSVWIRFKHGKTLILNLFITFTKTQFNLMNPLKLIISLKT